MWVCRNRLWGVALGGAAGLVLVAVVALVTDAGRRRAAAVEFFAIATAEHPAAVAIKGIVAPVLKLNP